MEIVIMVIVWALRFFQLILLGRVLLSWLPNIDYNNPIVRFLYQTTEPVLRPIRNVLPPMGGMDFSALVVFLFISIFMSVLM